ncbi:MAG: O-antigen ligase family protein [Chlorobi bacterium]|nr:O-antigen ligase family protein [Chlorobiota bacterium]
MEWVMLLRHKLGVLSPLDVGAAIAAIGSIVGAAATGQWYIVVAVGAAGITLRLLIRYQRLHWVVFFGIMPWYFHQVEEGISVFDIVMAAYLASLLLGWFVWVLAVRREELMWNRSDAILWLGLIGSLFSAISAVSRGISFLDWAREWAMLATVGYYFVLRSLFSTEDGFEFYVRLLVLMTVSLVVIGVLNFREQILQALYAYQIRGTRGVNAVYLIGFFLSVSLFLFARRLGYRLLWLVVAGLIVGGIIATYTRTVWVGTAVGILVMLVLLPSRQRWRLVVALAGGIVIIYGIARVVLGPAYPTVSRLITYRFLTLRTATKQASIIERRDETRQVLHLLSRPDVAVAGIGAGNRYVYYDSYLGKPVLTHFTHNGMLGLLLKFGIPVGLTVYLFHLVMVAKSFVSYFRSRHTRWEPYVLPFTLTLFATTIIDWTTNAFLMRSGAMFLGMLYAGIAIADRLIAREISRSYGNDLTAP